MKFKIISTLLLSIFLVLSAVACDSNSEQQPTPTPIPSSTLVESFTTFTDDVNGFSISVPDSWETSPGQTGDFFSSPSTCAGWPPSVAVTASYEEGNTSVQTYYTEVFEPYIEGFDDYGLVSREDLTIDGIPAIKVIYNYGSSEGDPVQEMTCVIVDEQRVWFVIESCITTCWDTYEDIFNTMLNSFHLLD